jgi:hypothetical protein
LGVGVCEILTFFASEALPEACSDPRGAADEALHRSNNRLYVGDDLNRGGTPTNDCDPFAFQYDRIVPISAVKHWSLECLSAFDGRPFPFVQHAGSIDQNITSVTDDASRCEIFDLDQPLLRDLVPDSLNDLVT